MLDYNKIIAMMLRDYGDVLTDEEYDEICSISQDHGGLAADIADLGAPFNNREVMFLSKLVGNMNDTTDFDRDGDLWTDDTLDKYAEFVHNYMYQYNDEALKVDPNTDTEQMHIGPMAQDLEKVNPAVVKEDPKSGYKTVDTGRLALMNAGAIADLARKIEQLEGAV